MGTKTAIVTGGSRGIGRATVKLLTENGYNVAFCYASDEASADEVAKATGAVAYKADVSIRSDVDMMVNDVIEKFGHVDVLVNNAAISSIKLFTDITAHEWDRIIAVNLTGVFNCTQSVLPNMIHRKSGRIINISSMWGVTGGSCEVHYSAAKAALIGMTKALAKEEGPSGITVNCIAPGVIDTDMNAHLTECDMKSLADDTPLGRIGTPSDVANAVAFLASDEASFITGQVIGVDGGII